MAVRVEKVKCPNCRKMVSYERGNYIRHFGTPFRKCRFCGYVYFDPRYRELAVYPYEHYTTLAPPKLPYTLFVLFLILSGGVAFGSGLYSIFSRTLSKIFVLSATGFGFVFPIYKSFRKKYPGEDLGSIKKEYNESYERLKNPEYIKLLKEKGVELHTL